LWELTPVRQAVETAWISASVRRTFVELLVPAGSGPLSINPTASPYFDAIEVKGGGDAVSAARAVIQTGEYDYAWNMQVEDEILLRLENGSGARGRTEMVPSRGIEHIQLNSSDP
jgi:hypothetical protein